jgi:hypothetical protein
LGVINLWPQLRHSHLTVQFVAGFTSYGENSKAYRITLLSSQDFSACSLFYPVRHCSEKETNTTCSPIFSNVLTALACNTLHSEM